MTEETKDIMLYSWGNSHILQNPDHVVESTIDTYPECKTCGERSPAWALVDSNAPLYGYEVEVDFTQTVIVNTAARDLEEANKLGYFKVVDASPGVQVSDIRLYPVWCCQACRAVTRDKTHDNEFCKGTWEKDTSYDI